MKLEIKEKLKYPVIYAKKENGNLILYKKHKKKISILDKVICRLYEFPFIFLLKKNSFV